LIQIPHASYFSIELTLLSLLCPPCHLSFQVRTRYQQRVRADTALFDTVTDFLTIVHRDVLGVPEKLVSLKINVFAYCVAIDEKG
jgi:hypothetical protein